MLGDRSIDTAVKMISSVAEQATVGMMVMYIEIMNRVNLPQVFLWLHESAMFGQGSMLFNPQPGLEFTACDMVRNLILSSAMNKPLHEQEELLYSKWIQPIQSRCDGPHAVDEMLERFLVHLEAKQKPRETQLVSAAMATLAENGADA